jgi:hypothetical protein
MRQLVTVSALGIMLASVACGGGGPTGTPDQSPDDLRGTWRVWLVAEFTGTEIEFPCQIPSRGNSIGWSGTWVVTSASNPVQGDLDLEPGTGCPSPPSLGFLRSVTENKSTMLLCVTRLPSV